MDILATVTARLGALGYTVTKADAAALNYDIEKAKTYIKADTNQPTVPDGLFYVWADMAAGLFLADKKACGQLVGFDFEAPAKSISEGDTTVAFAVSETGTAERQFDALLSRLTYPSNAVLSAYRRIAW